jgi:hypothetical protein
MDEYPDLIAQAQRIIREAAEDLLYMRQLNSPREQVTDQLEMLIRRLQAITRTRPEKLFEDVPLPGVMDD